MKTAIILFNLGGPDSLTAVRPFLFNLFFDPAIIRLPMPARWLVAQMISRRRKKTAQAIYARMGGRSPILENTEEQARALETALGPEFRCFVVMRYWHPRAEARIRLVKEWGPARILLLPLYPQFSTTTTASSIAEWQRFATTTGLDVPTTTLCCFPQEPGFIDALASRVRAGLEGLPRGGKPPRVLFSAHGLPRKIVEGGDPYAWQVEQTVSAVIAKLDGLLTDWQICYQSRVGPLEWIGPATDDEIRRAGHDGVPLVVVPVAFVSEHSETLVELDIEYRHLAATVGVPAYVRVPTVDAEPAFIAGLADLVRQSLATDRPLCSQSGGRFCLSSAKACAFTTSERG